MKRRISLYIAEQLCDLDDDALVLLNVQREDLNNPSIMLNSYSQAVTLPGTAVNDIIFGHYFRVDHSVAGSYNPLVRVPFSIFNETGEILASGYCKLLNVRLAGKIHTYEVQLYGSFGEFIYGLAYDADGNKKTLASLDYLGGGDTELDFVIDKTAVQNAWARLGGDTTKPKMWDVINFAPCYNGIPDGEFDPGKAMAVPSEIGLTIPSGQQVSGGGYTLIELATDLDEWEARDLRSYLQRPVLSVKALLQAIANPANNGGWTLDMTDIDTTGEWPYLNTWITRPLLPSLGTYKQTTGSITATPSASATSGPDLVSIALANVPSGTDVTLRASFGLQVNLSSAPGQTTMYTGKEVLPLTEYRDVWFLQVVGYASDNSVVAASPVTIFGPNLSHVSDLAKFAEDCTFVPTLPTGQTAQYIAHTGFDAKSLTGSGTAFSSRGDFSLEVTGKNMASAKVLVKRGRILWKPLFGKVDSVQNLATLYTSEDQGGTAYNESTSLATGVVVSATTQSSSTLRSGAKVTKQMLLSTDGTPADYLLAICKSFGLYILADGASKTARIVRRKTLFQNETIDLTDRVDTSQEIELEPIAFDAKWYDWKHANVGGAFVKEYKDNSGREYGVQRVNTGYDFDASAKNVLDGVVLKGAAAVQKFGRFMINAPYTSSDLVTSIVNKKHINDSGYIANANASYYLAYFEMTETAGVLIGTNLSNTHPVLVKFTDSTYATPDSIIKPAGTYNTIEATLGPGYYAFCTANGVSNLTAIVTKVTPPVFIIPGSKYTLWDSNNDSQENDVPQYTGATTPLRTLGPYDFYDKAQFHEKDGKPVDGADVLLLYNGTGDALRSYPLEITDDVPDMDTLNGKPCWLFTNNITPLRLPHFSRYNTNIAGWISLSLDFGVPSELDIPGITYFDSATIYAKAWKNYIADRLDMDTKVLRCRVRLDGLQVGQELLRKFYWYRGALWTLNKISNYSLTTFDLAECEFVQVQDIDAYLNG